MNTGEKAMNSGGTTMNCRRGVKVTIVGTGFVGSTTAYTLMLGGHVSELLLIDINTEKAVGEVMDLNHGMPFARPLKIYAGDYRDCADSDIIIISAGANQKPGETRLDLVHKNAEIFKQVIRNIIWYNTDCILLVVTNPVDILTYVTYKISGFPAGKVIGSGTVLDTARFKYLIGNHTGIDPRDVQTYIIGEHGDTEVATWSATSIAGMPMDEYCKKCKSCEEMISRTELFYSVRDAAYEIINRKGATYYAVALAVRRIVEAIARDENSILTVSSLMDGQYGLYDVCLSLPTVIYRGGVARVIEMSLDEREIRLLQKSGKSLKQVISQLDIHKAGQPYGASVYQPGS
jgi:L-lactate dehydrogenase